MTTSKTETDDRLDRIERALMELAGALHATVAFNRLRERGATALADIVDDVLAGKAGEQETRPTSAPEHRVAA